MNYSRAWLLLLLAALIGLGVIRLRFDVEILNLLPRELPVAQGLKAYQQHFSDARELVITVEAPTPDEAEAAAQSVAELLRAQENLVAAAAWRPAWMENPTESTELVAALWLNQPPAVVEKLARRLTTTNLTAVLTEARERLATSLSPNDIALGGYDPYGLMQVSDAASAATLALGRGEELFASENGTFRLVFATAKPDLASYRDCRKWLSATRQVLMEAQRAGEFSSQAELRFTGRPVFVTEIATGMEDGTAGSVGGTLLTIGALFWLTHRRLRPLLWLVFLLLVVLAGTTALGGLFVGTVNVVSMGFASILLGLAEDFGIVIYQESRVHPAFGVAELRRAVAPGIFWSTLTTAGAFLALNLSSLPGLGQLGSFVAIGIVFGAGIMVYGYLPLVLKLRRKTDSEHAMNPPRKGLLLFEPRGPLPPVTTWIISVTLMACASFMLWRDGPRFDHSPNAFRPRNSEATETLERIKAAFGRTQEPLWVIVPGADEAEVAGRLARTSSVLSNASAMRLIAGFTLPTSLWPQPGNQKANRPALTRLLAQRQAFRIAAAEAGFTTNALLGTDAILDCWERVLSRTNVFWPSNQTSRWILDKVAARAANGWLALGLIHPTADAAVTKQFASNWPVALQAQGVILTGWELLGSTVFDTVVRELPRLLIPIALLVVISLWLAFRDLREVALSLMTLIFSGICLLGAMELLGWSWDLLNLMALPLLLGMGVDFSIHIQLALRRSGGDRSAVRRSVGRALLLAGTTTAVGFASLALSTNTGMASLGRVCALGIAITLLTAVHLLPVWWTTWLVMPRKVTAQTVNDARHKRK